MMSEKCELFAVLDPMGNLYYTDCHTAVLKAEMVNRPVRMVFALKTGQEYTVEGKVVEVDRDSEKFRKSRPGDLRTHDTGKTVKKSKKK